MRVTSFRAVVALGLVLAAGAARADDAPSGPPDREAGVKDAFAQAAAMIQGLSDLAPPAKVYRFKPEAQARARRVQGRAPGRAGGRRPGPQPVAPAAVSGSAVSVSPPAFAGRHLGPFNRRTVFSDFTVSVDETGPKTFTVSVVSSEFCEEVVVKDSSTKAILAKRSLDDEKAFSIQVSGHALDDKAALSVGVLKDGSLNYAFLPLLTGTGDPPPRPK
jgi:hypothetical protein